MVMELSKFENKVFDFILSEKLAVEGCGIVLAVSGGADSVALCFVLSRLKCVGAIDGELVVGHVNHKLRGEAGDGDEAFVREFAGGLGLKFVSCSVDVRGYASEYKVSVETAGRKLRREALIGFAKENGYGSVALGHHKDDNVETMVHRLLRGTGYRGLGGIWPKREFAGVDFVRPLLCVSKEEIVGYCRDNGLGWRHDHSNDEFGYTRNRLRHLLIPELAKDFSGPVCDAFAKLSAAGRRLCERVGGEADAVWSELVLECCEERIVMDAGCFARQAEVVQVELVRRGLVGIGSGERGLSAEHYRRVIGLGEKGSGKIVELPGGFEVVAEYGKIVFRKKQITQAQSIEGPVELEVGESVEFWGWLIEASVIDADCSSLDDFKARKDDFVEWFDYDKLAFPLVVRRRCDGDKFVPFGMSGAKLVGKFLTAAKVESQLRERMVVVADGYGIIWLAPVRACGETSVTPATKKILRIRICDL